MIIVILNWKILTVSGDGTGVGNATEGLLVGPLVTSGGVGGGVTRGGVGGEVPG